MTANKKERRFVQMGKNREIQKTKQQYNEN